VLNMKNNNTQLASVDLSAYVLGLARWVEQFIKLGFEPYIATFMFRSLPSSEPTAKQIMRDEVTRVYGRFLTEAVRNPWSSNNATNRPVLIGCADWPVYKGRTRGQHKMNGSGIHFGSVLLVPPRNRLTRGVKEHFEEHRRAAYVRPDHALQRIDIEHVEDDFERVVAYTFKSLLNRRCTVDDVVLLPHSRSERDSLAYSAARPATPPP